MKKYSFIVAAATLLGAAGCKKQAFVDSNTDPTIVTTIDPREEFASACLSYTNSTEFYYDAGQNVMPWDQQIVKQGGNPKTFLTPNNFGQRYSIFYPKLGGMLTDELQLINAMPASQKAGYVYISAIAEIYKIYYAYYVADISGSIPYTEAFLARYGGTLTPAYQSQQDLFALFESLLKADIATLKTTQTTTQVSLGTYDQFFGGSTTAWVKAANSLRLRLAFRLLKRDETTAKGIIASVLGSSSGDLMSSNADNWGLWVSTSFQGSPGSSDYDPTSFKAPKPTVDFMYKNTDPRIRNFYQQNSYSQTNITLGIAAGVIPATTKVNSRRFIGAPVSPDSAAGKYASWFTTKSITTNLKLDTISFVKYRLWQPAYPAYVDGVGYTGAAGTGLGYFPLITYAEFCFMEAEAIQRGYVSGDVGTWYNAGITASINAYDNLASKAKLEDYTPVSAAEITNYLAATDVKFNSAKALEQIAIQSYINFYKQPNEAWASFKRTGIPNSSTALANEDIVINGTVNAIPRRMAFAVPASTDLDYTTRSNALTQMMSTGEFGNAGDVTGRVWWDKK